MKISVIIPNWNRAHMLKKTVMSALNQTLSPLEVLVCDDGSDDGSEEAVRSIGDDRVKWIAGSRGGRPAIPRNRGLRESKGEWLAFLDSDDEWLPEKLEKQIELAVRQKCLAVSSNAFRVVPEKGTVGTLLNWSNNSIQFDDLLKTNQVICSSALIHKSLLKIIGGFPEERSLKALEDYSLWLRTATQTKIAYVNEPLLLYRDSPVDSIRRDDVDEWSQRRRVFQNLLRWFKVASIRGNEVSKVRKEYFIATKKCWKHYIKSIMLRNKLK